MLPSQGNSLTKAERLSSKTAISRLLNNGRWGSCSGVKYCYLTPNGEQANRIMVSVPKRLFKRAVKRNLLKRRIREAYRTQKNLISAPDGVDILFQYDSSQIMEYQRLSEIIGQILSQVK